MKNNIKKYNLNSLQKGILHTELLNTDLLINNISVFLIINENLDLQIFTKAINIFISKNNAFNIKIIKENENYFQYFSKHNFINFEKRNNSNFSETELKLDFETFSRKKIGVFSNSLFDIKLIKLSQNRTGIYLKTHHIISDSWSYFIFQKEVYDNYLRLKKHKIIEQNNSNSYIKFLEAEQKYLKSDRFISDKKYWDNKITTNNFNLFKNKYPQNNNNFAKRLSFELSHKETNLLNLFCKKNSISPYILILSGFSIFIEKIKNKKQISVFTPVRNRANYSEKNTFGLFVNTLPFEITTDNNLSFLEYLYSIKREYYKFLKHSRLPNNLLYRELRRDKNIKEDFFQVFFSFENTFVNDKKIDVWHFFEGEEISALSVHISDRAGKGKLLLEVDYKLSVFKEKEIYSIYKTTKNILKNAIKQPQNQIKNIEIISEKEKLQILQKFNKPEEKIDISKTIVDLFEEQAIKSPNKIAVISENRELSYQELHRKSDIVARKLLKINSTKNCVSVILERTEKNIISTIAVLKSGYILLQIDTEIPLARIRKILKIANSNILITSSDFIKKYNYLLEIKFLDIDNLLLNIDKKLHKLPKITQKNIATIYFTSGTTYEPKAININHLSYSNIIYAYKKTYELEKLDLKLLQLASFSFDVFMGDLCKTLPNGGTIILSSEKERKNIIDIYNLIKKHNINFLESTPGILNPLLDYIWDNKLNINNLNKIVFGADIVFSNDFYKQVNRFHSKIEIYNSYGLTETTIENTSFKANKSDNYDTKITPIGFPLANNLICILNNNKQLLPVGFEGEIYVGVKGISNGYINDNEGSKSKFIKNPFKKDEIIYKTGDIAKWLPDGNIDFLGRKDKQLKIRGFRVELSEIEYILKQQNFVKNAVVIPYSFNKNNKKLVAFIISDNKNLDLENLKFLIAKNLPYYMIPIKFYRIENLPLNKNGKIDRNSLNKLVSQKTINEKYIAPESELEIVLAKTISKILNLEKISINKNIFDAGTDSLLIMQMVVELENQNIKIEPQQFYKHPTIQSLAKNIIENKEQPNNLKAPDNKNFINFKSWKNDTKISLDKHNYKNILLTGATGFLGIHLLRELIENNYFVYCLVRKKENKSAKTRVEELYYYYFGETITSNFCVIEANNNLQINELNDYANKFEAVIHSAAIVLHFGKQADFENININFTKKIASFCKKHKKHLFYISTMSVSGHTLHYPKIFTENDSYFEQNINENQYIKSKFLAEQTVLKSMNSGLDATIFRVGNLTHRFEDGFFQKNIENNASYNKLRAVLEIKYIPENMLDLEIEMTAVDLSAKAIISLFELNLSNKKIYHVFNHEKIKLQELIKIHNKKNTQIKIVSQKEFMNKLLDLHKNNRKTNLLNSLLVDKNKIDLPENRHFTKHNNDFTMQILNQLNFSWNKIDENCYLSHIFSKISKK